MATAYILSMDPFLAFLLGAAMLGTLLVLVIGVVSFAVNGEFYKKNSNKLMRLRVLLQGLALLFFAILLFVILGK
ncbi:MAG: HIG1 domain-containing protein [Rhodospirillales bacterium]|nr:HIG1 domain-containing protein [Rhodospirillales bacterium]